MTKSPEFIVDAQVRRWNYERGLLDEPSPPGPAWPIITISRECGAGGRSLASILAERIGFTMWDKALVSAISEAGGGEESFVTMLDERRLAAIEEMIHGLMSSPHIPTNINYHRTLLRVVEAIAEKGGSIIVGRGANFICDPADRLAIRLVMPQDERVAAYARREDVPINKARRLIIEIDRARDGFVQQYFRRAVDDPAAYDLTLNSGTFTLEEIADLVVEAYEKKTGRLPAMADRPGAEPHHFPA